MVVVMLMLGSIVCFVMRARISRAGVAHAKPPSLTTTALGKVTGRANAGEMAQGHAGNSSAVPGDRWSGDPAPDPDQPGVQVGDVVSIALDDGRLLPVDIVHISTRQDVTFFRGKLVDDDLSLLTVTVYRSGYRGSLSVPGEGNWALSSRRGDSCFIKGGGPGWTCSRDNGQTDPRTGYEP
jgi:hypothetical protein